MAGLYTIFAMLQITQKKMGQKLKTLCEEIGLSLVAAWLLKNIIHFLPEICPYGQCMGVCAYEIVDQQKV